MANYPDSIYEPREKENRAGVEYDSTKKTVIFSEDIKKLDDEVVALETEVGLLPRSRARAYRATTNQAVATATWTKIQLNAENYDSQNEFDPVTNYRFTAKKAGYYHVDGGAFLSVPVGGTAMYIAIYQNGVAASFVLYPCLAGYSLRIGISDTLYLAANDYLELWIYHTSGVSKNIAFGSPETFMAIHKLSP